jgi:diaminopimelate decarboxylase
MFSWTGSVAPGHYRDASGVLYVSGVRGDDLITAYGTPLVIIDLALVRRAVDLFRRACEPFGMGISYAAKAFVCGDLARRLSACEVGIDVCSLGELEIVESARYPAKRLTLHGAGKTDAELQAAVRGRVGRVVLDGLSDLRRLAALATDDEPVPIILRLNTGVEVDTHAHVRTVGDAAKFGFAREEETDAVEIVRTTSALTFAGLHAHAGSQLTDSSAFVANASELLSAARRFEARGLRSSTLIAGGGFGVQYDPLRPQDAMNVAATITACGKIFRDAPLTQALTVEFEPGRSIVAHGGTTFYEVLAVKRRSEGNVVVVDGGMADNPRPMLYGAYHHIVPLVEAGGAQRPTNVFGRACESDFIARAMLPERLERGDFLVACTTGAYTYSMSSNYNGFPKPTVVLIEAGTHAPMK